MTRLFVRAHTLLRTHLLALRSRRPETGQATAEYALVLLGVAAIALLVVAQARSCRQAQSGPTRYDRATRRGRSRRTTWRPRGSCRVQPERSSQVSPGFPVREDRYAERVHGAEVAR